MNALSCKDLSSSSPYLISCSPTHIPSEVFSLRRAHWQNYHSWSWICNTGGLVIFFPNHDALSSFSSYNLFLDFVPAWFCLLVPDAACHSYKAIVNKMLNLDSTMLVDSLIKWSFLLWSTWASRYQRNKCFLPIYQCWENL